MTKRLFQVGEVWFNTNGCLRGPLAITGIPEYPLGHDGRMYTKDGLFASTNTNGPRLVLIHKDATGKVINATFDPALIGKDEEKRKPNLYEFWEFGDRGTVYLDEVVRPHDFTRAKFYARGGGGFSFRFDEDCSDRTIKCCGTFVEEFYDLNRPSTPAEIDAWIAKHGKPAKYNPEALAAQKGTMNPKTTTEAQKPTKPDPLSEAIAEADDRAKGLRDLQTKLAREATMQGDLKALRLEIALLRDKYPIEAAKVDPALIGKDEEKLKLYSVRNEPKCPDRYVETGERRAPKKYEWFLEPDGFAMMASFDFTSNWKILTKYTPPQEPTMPTELDPITKAIAEAEDRAKGLRDLQTKLAKAATMQGDLKALKPEIALLRDKYPIEAVKVETGKPKAKKAGKKVK